MGVADDVHTRVLYVCSRIIAMMLQLSSHCHCDVRRVSQQDDIQDSLKSGRVNTNSRERISVALERW